MRKTLLLVLLASLFTGAGAFAACNRPGAQWAFAQQYLLDWRFEETSCDAWQFAAGATRSYNVDTCNDALIQGYQAEMTGASGAGAIRSFYQDIEITGWSSSPSLMFMVNIRGNLGYWDRLKVTIRDPATNAVLETVVVLFGNNKTLDCTNISKQLSGTYSGLIRVHFEATIWSGSTADAFVVDAVNYHATQ